MFFQKEKKLKVLVGLSGGVDSAVTALLLKKAGHHVSAVFMKNFSSRDNTNHECPWKADRDEAYAVAKHLDIPIETWDFEEQYRETVVNYLFDTYQKGQTPNPDILCNSEIKFKLFLAKAILNGFDKIATGHYAQIKQDKNGYHLLKGKDPNKDQSYFLAGLNQEQLARSLFPIGHLVKPKVRQLAKKAKLPNAERKDSQGICFVGKVNLKDFLSQKISPKVGDVLDNNGKKIGEHEGVWFYTIGQRKGIEIGGGPALYVIKKDLTNNILVVGPKESLELYSKEVELIDWHWINQIYKFPIQAQAKIRYRQEDQKVFVQKLNESEFLAKFSELQFAVASGQTVAIYKNQELIASAIIK